MRILNSIIANFFKNLALKVDKIMNDFIKSYTNCHLNFIKKSSISYAGAIFLDKSQNFSFVKNKFLKNKGEIGGAIYYHQSEYAKILDKSNEFIKNKANYFGNNYASNVKKIIFSTENFILKPKKKNLKNMRSSKVNEEKCKKLIIYGIDFLENFVYMIDEPYIMNLIQIIPYKDTKFNNEITFIKNNGFYCLGTLKRKQLPVKMNFIYNISLANDKLKENLTLSISFRECIIGERLLDTIECKECLRGFYLFQRDFHKFSKYCEPCDKMSFNCFGALRLTPKKGFWRLNSKSTRFFECPNPSSCLGDTRDYKNSEFDIKFSSGVCQEGYSEPMCTVCDSNYGLVNENSCTKCTDKLYLVKIIVIICVKICFAFFSIVTSLRMCKSLITEKLENNYVTSSSGIKIFNSHIQVLISLSFLPFQFPSGLNYWLSLVLEFSPSDPGSAFSLECTLKSFGWRHSFHFFKAISSFFFPFLVCLIFTVVWEVFITLKIGKEWAKLNADHTITLFKILKVSLNVLVLLCYPDLLKSGLQIFNCFNVGDDYINELRLVEDFSIKCWNNSHLAWAYFIGITGIFFYGIFFPLIIYYKLFHYNSQHKLKLPNILFKYGYFYFIYKEEYFFWDILVIFRRFCFILMNVYFFTNIDNNQNLFPIIIFMGLINFSLFVHNHCNPYCKEYSEINLLEKISLLTLDMTVFSILIHFSFIFSNQKPVNFIQLIFLIFSIFANIFFLFSFVKIIYKKKIFSFYKTIVNKFSKNSKKINFEKIFEKEEKSKINFERKNIIYSKKKLLEIINLKNKEIEILKNKIKILKKKKEKEKISNSNYLKKKRIYV